HPPRPTLVPCTTLFRSDDPPSADRTANEILAKLLQTYRSAKTYSDNGLVTLRFAQDGQQFGEQSPCSVQFVRPNKLALHAFQAKDRKSTRLNSSHVKIS